MILVPTVDLPGRRWCTTTPHGDRKDHATPGEARQRAQDIAALAFDVDNVDRVTVWYRDEGDPRGWRTYTTIDVRPDLRGVA